MLSAAPYTLLQTGGCACDSQCKDVAAESWDPLLVASSRFVRLAVYGSDVRVLLLSASLQNSLGPLGAQGSIS